MRTRVLSSEEWHRIPAGSLPAMIPDLHEGQCSIVAVEDDAGNIVACMGILTVTQLEGLWIAPEHRNAGVARALMREAVKVARERGPNNWALCALADDEMEKRAEHLNGYRLPDLSWWVLPIGGDN